MFVKVRLPLCIVTIVLPLWVFVVAPVLTRIPLSFTYTADITSIDNFYDEVTNQFTGDTFSVTRYSYDAIQPADGTHVTIQNVFDVRTVDGDPIFSVDRKYGVDRTSLAHVFGWGDEDRDGYLFAPRGLEAGESFTYWHINYDGPAEMAFVEEEEVFGLKTFVYESYYEGVDIDQTDNLTYLPEVGVTRGVRLEPHLTIWIEPVTGMLVKYTDETTAYYYDLVTGETLHPWNSFSNNYQSASVEQLAASITKTRNDYLIVHVFVPLGILALAGWLTLSAFDKKRLGVLFIVSIIAAGGVWFWMYTKVEGSVQEVTIGISRWVPEGNPAYDQNIQGFKDGLVEFGFAEHENVTYLERTASADEAMQKTIAQEFLNEEVDLVYSLTTPGTLLLKNEIQEIPIVFSVVTYPVEAGVIESLQYSDNNLVGTRNWVSVGEQLRVFKKIAPRVTHIGFVHRTTEPNSTIQLEEMRAAAELFGITVIELDGPSKEVLLEEIKKELDAGTVDALYSACDTLVQGEAEDSIIELAVEYSLPSFTCNVSGVAKGDLVGVVADFYEIGRLAGEKAGRILEGASPTSLETNTVNRPHMYVNSKRAEALGLQIPQDILSDAKEVIE